MTSYLCDFTIITPVFNGANWLEETILSVLKNCDGLNYEYIVIDDGSVDDTPKILEKYKDYITIQTQLNQGEATAVNNGILAAKGEYVLIVSADDPMRSQELLVTSKFIMDTKINVVCTYPDWSMIDHDSKVIRDVIVEEFSIQTLVGDYVCIVGPGGVFRHSSASKINGRNPSYKFTSDYDFWLRLAQIGEFERIPKKLAYWRAHPNSTSISERGLAMGRERILVMKNFLKSNPTRISKRLAKSAMSNAYYQAALLVYFDRRIPARKWLISALVRKPGSILIFDFKIVTYIALLPISPLILRILGKLGWNLELPKHA
jgi:glycosyltransferase involved in cell wall biosynthesis